MLVDKRLRLEERESLMDALVEAYSDSSKSARKSHLARLGGHGVAATVYGGLAKHSRNEILKGLAATGAGVHGLYAAANLGQALQRDPRQSPFVVSKRKGQKRTRLNKRKNFQGYVWSKGTHGSG